MKADGGVRKSPDVSGLQGSVHRRGCSDERMSFTATSRQVERGPRLVQKREESEEPGEYFRL